MHPSLEWYRLTEKNTTLDFFQVFVTRLIPKYLKVFNPDVNERWIMLHHGQSVLWGSILFFCIHTANILITQSFITVVLPKAMTRLPELEGNSEFLLPEERYLERKSTYTRYC